MTVALVHDWLTGQRGGEHVLEAVLELLPGAELFALTHVPGSVARTIEARRPRTTWLSRVPLLRRAPGLALPLLPGTIESLDLRDFDGVLSISHCVAIGARARGPHLLYSLTPMRYAWDGFDDYARGRGALARAAGEGIRRRLQRWDRAASRRPRAIACISEHVRARIRAAYGRDARVVVPPVDTEAFAAAGRRLERGERFLALGAVRPNKRLDEVARAFKELALPLDIVGPGSPRALARLSALGGSSVSVLGELPRELVIERVARARALVHAAHEDFGIAPVEALAAGRPVVAFERSGVRESVGELGVLFAGSVVDGVRSFLERERDLPGPEVLRARAALFSKERFRETFSRFLREEGGAAFARALGPAGARPEPPRRVLTW
jgi:glycosyltransferase involved in cell wall biosynthesis